MNSGLKYMHNISIACLQRMYLVKKSVREGQTSNVSMNKFSKRVSVRNRIFKSMISQVKLISGNGEV